MHILRIKITACFMIKGLAAQRLFTSTNLAYGNWPINHKTIMLASLAHVPLNRVLQLIRARSVIIKAYRFRSVLTFE